MTLKKMILRAAFAATLVAGLATAAPAAAEADLALTVRATAVNSSGSARTGNVGLGKTGYNYFTVTNNGADTAEKVDVTVDTTGWPADQVITGVSGCIPHTTPAASTISAATNPAWFPCRVSDLVGVPGVPTETTIATGVSKKVRIAVKYGPTLNKFDVYDADGNRIESAWVCPAADRFVPLSGSVTTTTAESATANNTAAQTAGPQALWADVEITMTGPASIARGSGRYTFDFTVKNLGPCAISTDTAVDDAVQNNWTFVSATGTCQDITGVLLADGSDYQYCNLEDLAVGGSVTGSTTWDAGPLAKDLISSNQGTGIQLTFGNGDFTDPNASNNNGDKSYVVTKSMGCSSVGGGGSLALLGLGLAALLLRRRRVA